jgi:phosphoesterase RecJ-like protein
LRRSPTNAKTAESLAAAASLLEDADEIALACHVNPDADALGSMLGLSVFLRARGKRTVCSFGNEPFDPPRWVELLEGREALVPPKEFPAAPAVLVTCDTASLDRLGALAGRVGKAGHVVWLDHHVSNDGLGTIPVVDPAASSTSEIVLRLMKLMGGEIPDGAAECLYAGVVTDTGRFQYQAVTADTLRLGAELREHAFDHAKLVRALYEDNRFAYLGVLGAALQRAEHDEGADLIWTWLTQEDLRSAGVEPNETDDLIDVLRTARDADVVALVKEQRDGRMKVSLRSRGGHDVAATAGEFSGGGHRLAAGFNSPDRDVVATVDLLKAALSRHRSD